MNKIKIQERRKSTAGHFFCRICHSRPQIVPEILNEIEIGYSSRESPPQANFFYRIYHNRTQIINETVNEIEIQQQRKPAASEIVYNICHSRTQIIKEILKEIENRLNFFAAFGSRTMTRT